MAVCLSSRYTSTAVLSVSYALANVGLPFKVGMRACRASMSMKIVKVGVQSSPVSYKHSCPFSLKSGWYILVSSLVLGGLKG